MTTTVWRCEPRSHGRRKAASPLPGQPPSLPYPIDRRLQLCALVGTQHLFVVVRRRSCVVSGVGGAATCGGVRRAGAARAAHGLARVRVLLSCGCGLCGSACAAAASCVRVLGAEEAGGGVGLPVLAACGAWRCCASGVRAPPLSLCSRCR